MKTLVTTSHKRFRSWTDGGGPDIILQLVNAVSQEKNEPRSVGQQKAEWKGMGRHLFILPKKRLSNSKISQEKTGLPGR